MAGEKIKIEFPDGSKKDFDKGISIKEAAESIGQRLAQDALAGEVDGELVDLSFKLDKDSSLKIITFNDDIGKEIFRHSAGHVMSAAVNRIYKKVKQGVGPAIEDGFYQDFDMDAISLDDLPKIEEEMKKIVKEKLAFEKKDMSKKEAKSFFKDDTYKKQMIDEMEGDIVSVYSIGDYSDLCKGPHAPHTGKIKAFKLMKVAGAYWRGDSKNKMLQRIYGIAFTDKKDLRKHLVMLEEAEKRDHRKIGKEMDLFSFHEEGPGFPFFHEKGMVVWDELMNYWKKVHKSAGYVQIKTPMMLSRKLWEQSGHWENYRENMYTAKIDKEDFAIKPMNCPGGMLVYNEKVHSYRDMPMRVGEIGLVHRHELSGVLSGLFRVRAFHQDDAHIFMTPDQIKDEILGVLNLIDEMYSTFGLSYHLELSTRPEKSIGTDKDWEISTKGLKDALDSTGKEYQINEGDGAFYGPKIDVHIKDAIGRTWQCATIQLDMNLSERFDLTYEGKDGKKHRPVMIHRVIYGALERFLGILIEHYAGKFPLWINPVQVKILTIADRFNDYAKETGLKMEAQGLRVEYDFRSESMNKKVRDAQVEHVNYILVIGEKEVNEKTVNVRTRDNEVLGAKDVDKFINEILKEVKEKK